MKYEPRVGDMVTWCGEPQVVRGVDALYADLWNGSSVLSYRVGSATVEPARPTEVGQRVRFTDGHPGGEKWCGTVERIATGYSWTIARDPTDPLAKENPRWFARVENLIRIADKAEPSGAENKPIPAAPDAWPNRPRCGRPGHDPACLCSTGWVRQPEPEPEVREVWGFNFINGVCDWSFTYRPGAERVYCVSEAHARGPFHPTREGAIALWKARR